MATKSPLSNVKDKFKDKDGLIKAVKDLATDSLWKAKANGKVEHVLERVSNAKLLRLHSVLTEVKGKFGSREKLTDEVLKAVDRVKDAGYKVRLEKLSTPALLDVYRAAVKPKAKPAATAKKAG